MIKRHNVGQTEKIFIQKSKIRIAILETSECEVFKSRSSPAATVSVLIALRIDKPNPSAQRNGATGGKRRAGVLDVGLKTPWTTPIQ